MKVIRRWKGLIHDQVRVKEVRQATRIWIECIMLTAIKDQK